jgi:hypothetical protein
MDPYEVREERMTSGAVPPEGVAPAASPPPATPVAPAAPVAPAPPVAAGSSVYTSRTSVTPVGSRASQAIWLIVAVVDIILALDFVFRAAGANNTGFAHYTYRVGEKLSVPFDGIFNTKIVNGTSAFRWADVLAVVIYSILAWIVTKAISIAYTPKTGSRSA